jgi:hypothetical protein
MAEFVRRLHQRIGQQHQGDAVQRQGTVQHIRGEFRAVHHSQHDAGADQRQPEQQAREREDRAHQLHGVVQEAVRVEQRQPQGERVAQPHQQGVALHPLAAPRDLGDIGRQLTQQEVGAVELGQQQDGFLLARLGGAMPAADHLPRLPQRPPAVQQADHQIRRGRQPVEPAALVILREMP